MKSDYETTEWEYIPAKWQKPGHGRTVLWIIIHSTESLETEGGAREIARYFQNSPRPGSSHVVIDDREVIQCVHDADIAAGAVGANQNGIHIEQVGTAAQSAAQWDDDYSRKVIANCADVAAQYCLKYDIPLCWLEPADLKAKKKGISSHNNVSLAFPGTGHWDPGPNYNYGSFMRQVSERYGVRRAEFEAGSEHG